MGKVLVYLHTLNHSAVTVKYLVDVELAFEHILIIMGCAMNMTFVVGGPWLMLFGELGAHLIILVGLVGGVLQHLCWLRIWHRIT